MTAVAREIRDGVESSSASSPLAAAIDRWIYVFTALSFIAIVLAGFVPDSLDKIAAVEAGKRAAFPLVLHLHAVLMGSFLLLLLAQSWLMAVGREDLHRRLGLTAMVIAPALVVVGFVLVPTMYHLTWNAAQAAPAEARAGLLKRVGVSDDVMLLQLKAGVLFPLLLFIGLRARTSDGDLHKRMMFLATAAALPAGINRIDWLPNTFPGSPTALDLYSVLAVSPMLLWDLFRSGGVKKAYWVWLAAFLPVSAGVHLLWDKPVWHTLAHRLMGV